MFRRIFKNAKFNLDLARFQAFYKVPNDLLSLLKFKTLKYYKYQKNSGPLFWRTAPRCRNIESNEPLMGEMANRTDREDETSGRSKESGVGPH